MKISNKIIIVLTIVTSLIAVIGGLGIFANQQLANSFEELKD
jgi:predicted small integral membrane protein